MVPMEAMASGVATISSSSFYAGSSEHIKNGEALLINDPNNPKEISDAMKVLMDEAFRANIAEKGRHLAKKITWEMTTEATLSAYFELLQRKKG